MYVCTVLGGWKLPSSRTAPRGFPTTKYGVLRTVVLDAVHAFDVVSSNLRYKRGRFQTRPQSPVRSLSLLLLRTGSLFTL